MNDSYDREKVVEHMLDPVTSNIIAELEDGEKNSLYLAEKSSITETEVCERLSYLTTHGFIIEIQYSLQILTNYLRLSRMVKILELQLKD